MRSIKAVEEIMGKTIAEKILSEKSKKNVKADDIVIGNIDFCMGQDGTSPLAIEIFKRMGGKNVFNPQKIILVIDHSSPSPSEGVSNLHTMMRNFAEEQGCLLYDIGEGVCHQLMLEKGHARPGELVIGADSHTTTYGAISCLSCGVGSTDMAAAFISGKMWFKVPQTIKVRIVGDIPSGVYAKDIILYLAGQITADGATYLSLEFEGEVIENLPVDDRLVLSNMAVELGAKFGLIRTNEISRKWVEENTKLKSEDVYPDKDASYLRIEEYNISKLSPQIARPHQVDNTCGVEEVEGTEINQAFIGTCTNGRLTDLRIAAEILKDKKVHPRVRTIVAPASRRIYLEAVEEGIISTLVKAGAVVVPPGCGPCVGTNQGIPSDGEIVLSSANRNFKGRMGNSKAEIYLASPATVAVSSISGKIVDIRKVR